MNGQVVPMTYQNIGDCAQTMLRSLLLSVRRYFCRYCFYPENPELISLAGKVLFQAWLYRIG